MPSLPVSDSAKALDDRDYYELRAYRLAPHASSSLLDAYLEKALIPALNGLGLSRIGVFTQPDAPDGMTVWVLIPYTSLQTMVSVTAAVNSDPHVLKAGADYLQIGKANPAFDRVDSWLHLAFRDHKRLVPPPSPPSRTERIFELRTYQSYSETKALKKIDMFNDGEIDIMREVGLAPVFYGQALLGRDLPHLAYLLSGPDLDTYKKNWQAFQAHPKWQTMKVDPQYADTVSKITNRFLVPTPYSQI